MEDVAVGGGRSAAVLGAAMHGVSLDNATRTGSISIRMRI